ncbi:MAG TPA: pyrroloquinoline quinone biosynthesis protein PqqE [Rhodocyclaceae bacterium]|nr:pyrroloquinoline quinone biosynthesis protein PqqE [Rhodocyclaceae bacterium]
MNAPFEKKIGPPLWLLAEVTYRCPLHCVFCYNPVDFARHEDELDTEDWLRVLREARDLGAVQCGFSGGEPLLRDDLEILVAEARRLGFYTNLITSGIGLTEARLDKFKEAGLDHIQLSFQDSSKEINDFLTHTRTFDLKQRVGGMIQARGWPMVMNVVIHRLNIEHMDRIIQMAADLGAEYLELANAQYYSWALENRDHLMPSSEQLRRAEEIVDRWKQKLAGKMRILFVVPDYHEGKPKRCMNGWGNVFLTVTPDGTALPCHTARMLPGLEFPNVREMDVASIWNDSPGFNFYRGTEWMRDPCRTCEDKEKDLGGCRCQAYLLTKDASATDPVCPKSPDHGLVQAAVARADQGMAVVKPLVFRDSKESLRLS